MTTKDTVLAAINKAATQYSFDHGMIFHSDRGTQYASKATRNTLKSYNIVQSMSRPRNCWDNAVAESFFKSLKTELIYETKLVGAKQMKNTIFEYIEIWYRKQRRHSYLAYQTIEEFNKQYFKQNINNVA
ncbi:DDE-type integrase/transposase/recombinase [Bacteroides propionicifaciens]|uniref:DDE-type integrase/transposase/recombinase n=1 Tax=Bacteroides propionicifaciens TaxID=392838 RepID=UPI000370985C|nr:DDE-type integrase/transposase/recombinase [Bacteroides propionicifaciens]